MQRFIPRRLLTFFSPSALISPIRPLSVAKTCDFTTRSFSSWLPQSLSEEWGEERRALEPQHRMGVVKQHIVYISPKKNNTFITVTDTDGNKKFSTTVGSLHLGKGTSVPRFFSEPVTEHAGQEAVKLGIKSAIIRVKGSVFFKKKKEAILGFRKGLRSAGIDHCQIDSIQDCTRLAHNGCRLKKKRRV
ncbi:30S ribosomal protein S11 [Zostera marina]|uniref:30S ribosomal protein S11 n=1 Tax=Zostera marina TaxID=29655 RepID=A0A0K9PRI1_ZOSMR|nr:30S ribosomal protein S11 [Zostera marina]